MHSVRLDCTAENEVEAHHSDRDHASNAFDNLRFFYTDTATTLSVAHGANDANAVHG